MRFSRVPLISLSMFLFSCEPQEGRIQAHSKGTTSSRARLVDRTQDSGIEFRHERGAEGKRQLYETMGGGVAWLDYDQDGDPDLYLVSGRSLTSVSDLSAPGRNRLYRNDAGRFVDVTENAGVVGRGYGLGCVSGDIDSDGHPDIYVLCYGDNILYHNRGDGTFEEVAAGVKGESPFSGGAAIADFDGDGRSDIYLASYVEYDFENPESCTEESRDGERVPIYCGPMTFCGARDQLFLQNANGTFRDATERLGLDNRVTTGSKSLAVLAADFDDDGDVDLYVACDTTGNLFFRNRGDGTFDEVGLEIGVAVSDAGGYEGGMGVAIGDLNDDQRADIFVTNFAGESNRVYLQAERHDFVDGNAITGLGRGSRSTVGWGTVIFDLGSDGTLDVFIANGHIYDNAEAWLPEQSYEQGNLLYSREGDSRESRSQANRRFIRRGLGADSSPSSRGSYRGLAMADYDLDGQQDILVIRLDAAPLLLHGEGTGRHYLGVELQGSGHGGRDAVGARVVVETARGVQVRWRFSGGSYLSGHSPRLHFGLEGDTVVRRLTIHWPGGGTTVLENLSVDRTVTVRRF